MPEYSATAVKSEVRDVVALAAEEAEEEMVGRKMKGRLEGMKLSAGAQRIGQDIAAAQWTPALVHKKTEAGQYSETVVAGGKSPPVQMASLQRRWKTSETETSAAYESAQIFVQKMKLKMR